MIDKDFLPLFLKHERELAGFARALLPDWDAVDETLQEASLVMWRKIDQLKDSEEFLPWAKVILRFEILKQRRKMGRDRLVLDDSLIAILAAEDTEQKAGWEEVEKGVLQDCLQQFSSDHQELLLAPYTGGGRVKQMADAAGRSSNSLYKMLGRLRRKLHDCVSQQLAAS